MAYKKDGDVREAHPGWAVRFEDGTWLGGGHGWFRAEDAFYADIYDSKEQGLKYLEDLRNDPHKRYGNTFDLPAEAVEAWQPICETLRLDVSILKKCNTIEWMDIVDLREDLQQIMDRVKKWETRSHLVKLNESDEE